MFKYILLIIILFSLHIRLTAQVSNIVFLGTASVKNSETYSYKLQVSDSNSILNGYSVTDLRGPNETKTAITGSLDIDNKLLNIRETKIIYTKSAVSPADFCFISSKLKISKIQGMTMLRGSFKGYKQDGKTKCAEGRLTLASSQDVLDKLLKIAAEDSIPRTSKDSVKTIPAPMQIVHEKEIPASEIKKVLPGEMLELLCPSKDINVEIWDAKTIDGDKIKLTQDNVTLLDDFILSGMHKNIAINMAGKDHVILQMTALYEGSEPLNTARLKIISGTRNYYVDATTTIGKNVTVILKKE